MIARQSKNRLLSVYNANAKEKKLKDHKFVSQEAIFFFQHLFGDNPYFRKRVGGRY